jgi:putative hydrolase of the HAD superfamily
MSPRRSDPQFRMVFLDVGGTLIDNHDFPAWTDAAHCLGVDVDIDTLAQAFRDGQLEDPVDPVLSAPEWWRRILSHASEREVPLAVSERFLERLEALPPRVRLYSDTGRCLAALKRQGRDLGIVSNSRSRSHLEELLEGVGIRGYFSTIISSGTEGVAKPDPAIFRLAVERARVRPDEAFYVGDLPNTDARAAAIAGLRSVWLHRDGTGFGEDPPEITSLTELPGLLRRLEADPDLRSSGVGRSHPAP